MNNLITDRQQASFTQAHVCNEVISKYVLADDEAEKDRVRSIADLLYEAGAHDPVELESLISVARGWSICPEKASPSELGDQGALGESKNAVVV